MKDTELQAKIYASQLFFFQTITYVYFLKEDYYV